MSIAYQRICVTPFMQHCRLFVDDESLECFAVDVGGTTHPLFAIAHRAFYPYGAQCAGWHVGA